MVPELGAKMYEKRQKSGFTRNPIILKLNIFFSKFDTKIFKSSDQIVSKCQDCIFWTGGDITRQGALRPGRAGPGQFITDIDHRVKKNRFLFHTPYRQKKTNRYRDIELFESPI